MTRARFRFLVTREATGQMRYAAYDGERLMASAVGDSRIEALKALILQLRSSHAEPAAVTRAEALLETMPS